MMLKLFYDRKAGRMEIRRYGASDPIATLDPEEFADLLGQINEFVAANSPHIKRAGLFARTFRSSMRKESWKWIGGVVKEKIRGIFGK